MTRIQLTINHYIAAYAKNNNYNSLKMGYFSQRKKHERENLFMTVSLSVTAIVYFVLLFDGEPGGFIEILRGAEFHFYLFNIFLLLFTLWHRKILYSFLALLLLFWGYTSIAKTSRLLFSDASDSPRGFDVAYKSGSQDYDGIINNEHVILRRFGKIELSPGTEAFFKTFEKYDQVFTLVNLDFSKVKASDRKLVFANLGKFVLNQDEPVIIVGDLGVPSWSPLVRDFLIETGLQVKNHIIYSDGEKPFSFFNIPTVNILGFDNIGINHLQFRPETKVFDIRLAF